MIIVAYLLFTFLVLRFVVLMINYLSKPYLPKGERQNAWPKVSILIPARNEEANLPELLVSLQKIDYPDYEVIVCNDHSEDGTEQILKSYQKQFPQLLYFNNDALPAGWIGKNFACHQLAQKATGQYFLFIDADVKVKPQLLTKAISYMQKRQVKLLSIFPEQIIGSPGEWKTVPLMNWILLTFLPLRFVRWKWFSSLSAANGQFMLFDGKNYRCKQWHRLVKSRNVEDIIIARYMKRRNMPIAVLLGRNDIACRMYNGYGQAIKGFSLNVHQYFGGNRLWMLFFGAMVWLRLPYFVVSKQYVLLVVSVAIILFMKIIISKMSHYPLPKMLYYHYSQLVSLHKIIWLNLKNSRNGTIEWKGRSYKSI
jgi:glycosyltransferase involved in cell wall biosynthesis